MRQGTTPIVSLTIPVARDSSGSIIQSSTLDDCKVYVTISQGSNTITKSNEDSEDIEITKNYDASGQQISTTVAMYLSQTETFGFQIGAARAQLRWVNDLEEAYASDVAIVMIDETLYPEVIQYQEAVVENGEE